MLWLLDEPTTNLDADGQQLVRDLIDEQLAATASWSPPCIIRWRWPPEQRRDPGTGGRMKTTRRWRRPAWSPLRDLRLAFRKPSQLLQPLMFFMIVATLFPLTLTPEMSRLRDAAPGVLWIGALLSSLLALEFLFRDDAVGRDARAVRVVGTVADMDVVCEDLHALAADRACRWRCRRRSRRLALGVPVEAMGGVVASLALGSFAHEPGRARSAPGSRSARGAAECCCRC